MINSILPFKFNEQTSAQIHDKFMTQADVTVKFIAQPVDYKKPEKIVISNL
jgi:hypothetical protein